MFVVQRVFCWGYFGGKGVVRGGRRRGINFHNDFFKTLRL